MRASRKAFFRVVLDPMGARPFGSALAAPRSDRDETPTVCAATRILELDLTAVGEAPIGRLAAEYPREMLRQAPLLSKALRRLRAISPAEEPSAENP